MRAALPSAWRTFSIEMEQSPTALLSMRQTCSVWRSTGTRTSRFVCHTFHKIETRHKQQWCGCHLQIRNIQSLLRFLDILTFTWTDDANKNHSSLESHFLFFCKIWTSGETMWTNMRINNITYPFGVLCVTGFVLLCDLSGTGDD